MFILECNRSPFEVDASHYGSPRAEPFQVINTASNCLSRPLPTASISRTFYYVERFISRSKTLNRE